MNGPALLHDLSFADISRENRRSHPLDLAAVDGESRLTHFVLDDRTTRLANALMDAGVGQGDRVLSITMNSSAMLETLIACAKAGAVYCPGNWRQSADELRFVIEDLSPKVVLWQQNDLSEATTEARAGSDGGAMWLCLDGDDENRYEDFLSAGSSEDRELYVDPSVPLLAMYTAAFEGRPNAALLSHSAIIGHSIVLCLAARVEPGFKYLCSGPLFHVGTMMFAAATFLVGGANVFMARFDAAEACRIVEAERCDSMFLVPPMIDAMKQVNAEAAYDLSSLRLAPGDEEWNSMITVDDSPWARSFGGYGQTEVGGMLSYSGFGVGGIGTFGRPSPLLHVRILGPDGEEVPSGEVGEIVARGLHVATGFHDRPELQAARQSGGWHHTGDLGRREPDGTLTFVGPRARLIKSASENIYPAEVERALGEHPAVESCAVIGIPDDRWDQSVKALVVVAEGQAVTAEELIEHCRGRLASYKKPRYVEFVSDIPRKGFSPDYDELDRRFGGGGYPGS